MPQRFGKLIGAVDRRGLAALAGALAATPGRFWRRARRRSSATAASPGCGLLAVPADAEQALLQVAVARELARLHDRG